MLIRRIRLLCALLCVASFALAQVCVTCHKTVTPGIVTDWQLSKHSQNEVDCSVCHGGEHTSATDVVKVKIPTPETCAGCHSERFEQFKAGKHAAAWAAMKRCPPPTPSPSP